MVGSKTKTQNKKRGGESRREGEWELKRNGKEDEKREIEEPTDRTICHRTIRLYNRNIKHTIDYNSSRNM